LRITAFLTVLTLVGVVFAGSGCLGIERTEWAFRSTQIHELQVDGLTGEGVTVGIVDSGIDLDHPALRHVTLVAWRDYVGERPEAYDDSGHGTHVAGILAARASTGQWLAGGKVGGVSPGVDLVVAKACGAETCDPGAVERAIDFVVDNGADIVVLSLGGRQAILNLGESHVRAVERAAAKGVFVVAAAGNSGSDWGDVNTPASARLAIAVGAVDEDLRVANFSSRGSERENQGPLGTGLTGRSDPHRKPELVAPGVEILSTYSDGGYARASGTSQAAPFVAGVIALMLEDQPQWKRSGSMGGGEGAVVTLKQVLTESALPVPGQRTPHDNAAGYGLVQAVDALKRLAAA
jgi:minor extracellular protease Epr